MKRDAQATRKRILDAALAEFSAYGLAGARVDRIAAAAGSNKAMIYTYFGSKEQLLKEVTMQLADWLMNEVPFDPEHLPEYAASLYDRNYQRPELMRLVNWGRLENDPGGEEALAWEQTVRRKIEQLQQAQDEGKISRQFPAPQLFELLMSIIEMRAYVPLDLAPEAAHERRRQTVKDAVQALVVVGPSGALGA